MDKKPTEIIEQKTTVIELKNSTEGFNNKQDEVGKDIRT